MNNTPGIPEAQNMDRGSTEQSSSGNPPIVETEGVQVHYPHRHAKEERQFQHLFLRWKGMKLIHERLQDILDKYTREFWMTIEVCEEEKGFEDEGAICKFGEQNVINCPDNWLCRVTAEDIKRVKSEIEKECLSLQQSVRKMAQTLATYRKSRSDLHDCHQKWKGLMLMNRALLKQDEVMRKLEDTVTTIAEEKNVDNEQYIFNYAKTHSSCNGDEEQILTKWPLESITSEIQWQRTYEELQASCNQVMTQNKVLVGNISAKRKMMEKRGIKGSSENEKKLMKEKKQLQEQLQKLKAGYQKLLEECKEEKQRMDSERHQWGMKDAETIARLAAKDTECDKLEAKNIHLINQCKQKGEDVNSKWKKTYRQVLSEKEQRIKHLECQKEIAENSIQGLESEKETLLTRLSKIAGAKLTQGNAAITDLSDKDRPMKIAETYSELYDNEWTDALEELLVNGATDNQGIVILLQIVTEAYEFCCKLSQRYQDGIIQSITCLPVLSSVTSLNRIILPTTQVSTTCNSIESCASLASYQATECGQSPKSPNSYMEVVQLTEELKQTLGDLRKDLLPQLSHAVEQQYGGILNGLLQHHFGKKAFSTKKGKAKSDETQRKIGANITKETTERETCEVDQFENLDAENDDGKPTVLTKMTKESAENSDIHQHQTSCLNEGNTNENDVKRLLLQENKPPLPSEQAGVNLDDRIQISLPEPTNSSEAVNFSDQHITITKPDVKTKTDEDIIKEEVTSLKCPFIKTKSFANKCVNLCWMMRMKEPPLHMIYDIKPGSRMDTDTFKHYTQSGTFVSFVVWPALRLHKDGALLAKGVAQPMTKAEELKKESPQPTKYAEVSGKEFRQLKKRDEASREEFV